MAQDIPMLALSPTMEQGVIVSWHKQIGDEVVIGDLLCEVETDKAVMDFESPAAGVLLHIFTPKGSSALVGEVIAVCGKKGDVFSHPMSKTGNPSTPEENLAKKIITEHSVGFSDGQDNYDADKERVCSSPLARNYARAKGIDISLLKGSGLGGRVVKRDIENAVKNSSSQTEVAENRQGVGDYEISLTGKRRVIAKRLVASKFSAPHYYLTLSVFMEKIIRARAELNERIKQKISLNSFLLKFTAEAIKKNMLINSSWGGDKIIQHQQIDIALAVALKDGLVAPVVRNCGKLGILAIEQEFTRLLELARNNKLGEDDMANPTFTISNLGSFGIEEFTAIINPPAAAILAIGSIRKQPVFDTQEQIIARQVMKMTLSCDHRLLDGVISAAFMRDLKQILEHPIVAFY